MASTLRRFLAVALAISGAGGPTARAASPPEEDAGAPGDREEEVSPAADEKAEDRAAEARAAELAKELARHPPTEAQLGVPIYPGARFDPETSASMSVSDEADYFLFLSADAPDKVAAFYEKKTGKKGLGAIAAGGVLFAVRGSPPWPELGVTVQENMLAHGWRTGMRTVVTFRKARGK